MSNPQSVVKRPIIGILAMVPLLVALWGCGGGGGEPIIPSPTYDIANYFPLNLEDVWVYSDSENNNPFQYEITGTDKIGGEEVFIRNDFFRGDEYNEFWSIETGSLKFMGQEDNTGKYYFSPGLPVAGSAMRVGQTFGGSAEMFDEFDESKGPVNLQATFEGVEDVTDTTPNYYSCLKIKLVFLDPSSHISYPYYRWYLAQGIGMVKYEIIEATDASTTYLYNAPLPDP